jgi:hypothetical protein
MASFSEVVKKNGGVVHLFCIDDWISRPVLTDLSVGTNIHLLPLNRNLDFHLIEFMSLVVKDHVPKCNQLINKL